MPPASADTIDDKRASSDGTPDFQTAEQAVFDAYDLEVGSNFVDVQTPPGRVHVLEAGSSQSPEPPLVFVHATAAFGALFAPLLAQLTDRRLITFDRPGYGRSDAYDYRSVNCHRAVDGTLLGVLDALDLDVVDLVGHSMGATASVRFANAHSERVCSLALLGAFPGCPGTTPPLHIRLLTVPILGAVVRRLQSGGEAGARELAAAFGERDVVDDHPALLQAIAAHEADPENAETGVSEFRAVVSPLGWRPGMRLDSGELRACSHPTTVVVGPRDPLGGPDDVRGAVDAMSNATLHAVDAGHVPFVDQPVRCADLVREPVTVSDATDE